ncbi:hypothetical protein N665_1415s0010 [Sinapis alba]|nr:hypothetical protein N665_1415s0010 [Sinapis alba]
MAKLSCSYFLVLLITFSVCLMVKTTEGKICEITIDKEVDCIRFFCGEDCDALHNGGLGYCLDDPKVPGSLNCRCRYNC